MPDQKQDFVDFFQKLGSVAGERFSEQLESVVKQQIQEWSTSIVLKVIKEKFEIIIREKTDEWLERICDEALEERLTSIVEKKVNEKWDGYHGQQIAPLSHNSTPICLSGEQIGSNFHQQTFEVSGPVAKKEGCLYFPGVFRGTFQIDKGASEPGPNSIYAIEKIDENRAKVYVENNMNAVVKFSNNIDAHETACDSENPRVKITKGILTVEPGEATLEGNMWKISKKVKIRYQ